jgi:hypothetical protein
MLPALAAFFCHARRNYIRLLGTAISRFVEPDMKLLYASSLQCRGMFAYSMLGEGLCSSWKGSSSDSGLGEAVQRW